VFNPIFSNALLSGHSFWTQAAEKVWDAAGQQQIVGTDVLADPFFPESGFSRPSYAMICPIVGVLETAIKHSTHEGWRRKVRLFSHNWSPNWAIGTRRWWSASRQAVLFSCLFWGLVSCGQVNYKARSQLSVHRKNLIIYTFQWFKPNFKCIAHQWVIKDWKILKYVCV